MSKKTIIKILSASIATTLAIGIYLLFTTTPSNIKNEVTKEDDIVQESKKEEDIIHTANLIGVGDNLIHGKIYWEAQQRTNDGSYDFTYAYQNIAPYITQSDIASINQETMMAGSKEPSHYPLFNSPTELAYALDDIGFDVVAVANNHMFDQGNAGLLETLNLLHSIENFSVIGAYRSLDEYHDIPIITKNNISFSFVSATDITNGFSLDPSYGMAMNLVNNEQGQIDFIEQVKEASKISDVVVVNIHWGDEYATIPNNFQTSYAQELVDAGANIIIGHHPHVIQPVDTLYNKDGEKAIVAYSLGNFLSAQDQGLRLIGGLFDVEVTKTNDTVAITSFVFKPVITHFTHNFTDITNYLYSDYTSNHANVHGIKTYTPDFSMNYIYNEVTSIIDSQYLPDDFLNEFINQ